MPDDNDSIDFEHRLSRAEEAALEDVKEINALKKEIANLRENLRDVLQILGVTFGSPFVWPQHYLQPEQTKGYDEALKRLREEYFEFPKEPS